MNELKAKTRNLSVDLIKIVAMLGVICLHTIGPATVTGRFGIAEFFYGTAVVSIPLFFMVSGYLLLGRTDIDLKYATRKVLGIIKFIGIITVSYWLFHSIFNGLDFNLLLTYGVGAFLQIGPLAIFWYLGAMCLVYLLAVPINRLYNNSGKWFFLLFIGMLLLENLAFSVNISWRLLGLKGGEWLIPQMFRLHNWIFYFMLGGVLKQIKGDKIIPLWAIALLLIMNVALQGVMTPVIGSKFCEFFYCSIFVAVLSAGIFLYLLNIKIKHEAIIRRLSGLFLPVYAIHKFIIATTNHWVFTWYDWGGVLIPLLYWVVVSIVSFSLSYVIMKIPFMDKIFKI